MNTYINYITQSITLIVAYEIGRLLYKMMLKKGFYRTEITVKAGEINLKNAKKITVEEGGINHGNCINLGCSGINHGTVESYAHFFGTSKNHATIKGEGFFYGESENHGTLKHNGWFKEYSINYGSVEGENGFDYKSRNYGTIEEYDEYYFESLNYKTIKGDGKLNKRRNCKR